MAWQFIKRAVFHNRTTWGCSVALIFFLSAFGVLWHGIAMAVSAYFEIVIHGNGILLNMLDIRFFFCMNHSSNHGEHNRMGWKRETPAPHRRLHPMETARRLPGSIRPPLAGFESLSAKKMFQLRKALFCVAYHDWTG